MDSINQSLSVRIGVNGINDFSNRLKEGYSQTKDSLMGITEAMNEEIDKAFDAFKDRSQDIFSSLDGQAQATSSIMGEIANGHADMVNEIGSSYKNYIKTTDPKEMKKLHGAMMKDLKKLRGEAVIWSKFSGIAADQVVSFKQKLISTTGDIDAQKKMFGNLFEFSAEEIKKGKGWKEFHKFFGDNADEFADSYAYAFRMMGNDAKKTGTIFNKLMKQGGELVDERQVAKILSGSKESLKELKEEFGSSFDPKDMENYFKALLRQQYIIQKTTGMSEEDALEQAKQFAMLEAKLQAKQRALILKDGGESYAAMMKDVAGISTMMGVDTKTLKERLEKDGLMKTLSGITSEMNDEQLKAFKEKGIPQIQAIMGDVMTPELMDSFKEMFDYDLKQVGAVTDAYNKETERAMKSNEKLSDKMTKSNKKHFKGAIRTAEDYADAMEEITDNVLMNLTEKEASKYIRDHAKRVHEYAKDAVKLAEDGDTYFAGSLIKRFSAMKRMGVLGLFVPTDGKPSRVNTYMAEVADASFELLKSTAPVLTAMGTMGFQFQHIAKLGLPVTSSLSMINKATMGMAGPAFKLTTLFGGLSYVIGKLGEEKVMNLINGDGAGEFLKGMKDKVSYDITRIFMGKKMLNDLNAIKKMDYERAKGGGYSEQIISTKVIEDAFKRGDQEAIAKISAVYGIAIPTDKTGKKILDKSLMTSEAFRKELINRTGQRSGDMLETTIRKRIDTAVKVAEMGLVISGKVFQTLYEKIKLNIFGGMGDDGEFVVPLYKRIASGVKSAFSKVMTGEFLSKEEGENKDLKEKITGLLGFAFIGSMMSGGLRKQMAMSLIGAFKGAFGLATAPIGLAYNAMIAPLMRMKTIRIGVALGMVGAGYKFFQMMSDPTKRANFATTVEAKLGLQAGTLSSIDKFGTYLENDFFPKVGDFLGKAWDTTGEIIGKSATFFTEKILPKIPGLIGDGIVLIGKGLKEVFTSKTGWLIIGFTAGAYAFTKIVGAGLHIASVKFKKMLEKARTFATDRYNATSTAMKGKVASRWGAGASLSKKVSRGIAGSAGMLIGAFSDQITKFVLDKEAQPNKIGGYISKAGMALSMVNPILGGIVSMAGLGISVLFAKGKKMMGESKFSEKLMKDPVYLKGISEINADLLKISKDDMSPAVMDSIKEKVSKKVGELIKKDNASFNAVGELISKTYFNPEVMKGSNLDTLMKDAQKQWQAQAESRAKAEYKANTNAVERFFTLGVTRAKIIKENAEYYKEQVSIARMWAGKQGEAIMGSVKTSQDMIKVFETLKKQEASGEIKNAFDTLNSIKGLKFDKISDLSDSIAYFNREIVTSDEIAAASMDMNVATEELQYLKDYSTKALSDLNVGSIIGGSLDARGSLFSFMDNLQNIDSVIDDLAGKSGIEKAEIQKMYMNSIGKLMNTTFDSFGELRDYLNNLNSKEVERFKKQASTEMDTTFMEQDEKLRKFDSVLGRVSKIAGDFDSKRFDSIIPDDVDPKILENLTTWGELGNAYSKSIQDRNNLILTTGGNFEEYSKQFTKSMGTISSDISNRDFGKLAFEEREAIRAWNLKYNGTKKGVLVNGQMMSEEEYNKLVQYSFNKQIDTLQKERANIASEMGQAGLSRASDDFRNSYDYLNTEQMNTLAGAVGTDAIRGFGDLDIVRTTSSERLEILEQYSVNALNIHNRLATSKNDIDNEMAIRMQEVQKKAFIEAMGGADKAEAYFRQRGMDALEFNTDNMNDYLSKMDDAQQRAFLSSLQSFKNHSGNVAQTAQNSFEGMANAFGNISRGMLEDLIGNSAIADKILMEKERMFAEIDAKGLSASDAQKRKSEVLRSLEQRKDQLLLLASSEKITKTMTNFIASQNYVVKKGNDKQIASIIQKVLSSGKFTSGHFTGAGAERNKKKLLDIMRKRGVVYDKDAVERAAIKRKKTKGQINKSIAESARRKFLTKEKGSNQIVMSNADVQDYIYNQTNEGKNKKLYERLMNSFKAMDYDGKSGISSKEFELFRKANAGDTNAQKKIENMNKDRNFKFRKMNAEDFQAISKALFSAESKSKLSAEQAKFTSKYSESGLNIKSTVQSPEEAKEMIKKTMSNQKSLEIATDTFNRLYEIIYDLVTQLKDRGINVNVVSDKTKTKPRLVDRKNSNFSTNTK